MKTKLAIFLVFTTLCFSGCSKLSVPGTNSPNEFSNPVHLVVLSMTKKYLDAIVRADDQALDRVVLWGEYNSEFNDITRTRKFILQKIKALNPSWVEKGSPFKNFKVKGVDVDKNSAEVELSRNGEELEIDFLWTGRAWLIVDDNIFGDSGYVTRIEG